MADPLTLALAGGVASGTTGGLMGLFGGGDEPSSPGFPFGGGMPGNAFLFLMSLLNSAQQKKVLAEYERKQDVQIQDMLRIAQEATPETMRLYDADAQQALTAIQRGNADMMRLGEALPGTINRSRLSFLGNLAQQTEATQRGYGAGMEGFLGGVRGDEADILGGYRDRYKFAEEELEGYGEQQKSDIERMFGERSGEIASDLVSRGLASSTESAKRQLLNTELESGEQRRLGEDLTRNRVNILGGILGEQSAAQERLAGQRNQYGYGGLQAAYAQQSESDRIRAAYDAAMRGDVIGAQQALIGYGQQAAGNEANFYTANAANRSNIFQGGTNTLLNTLGSINYIPPPPNDLSSQFGQLAAPTPASASAGPSAFANALPGLGNFGGALAMNYFNRPRQANPPLSFSPFVNTGYDSSWMTGPPPASTPAWMFGPPASLAPPPPPPVYYDAAYFAPGTYA